MPECSQCGGVSSPSCKHLRAFEDGTPEASTKRLCVGHSDERMLNAIHDVVSNAKTVVDISNLAPFPDTRFMSTLRNAITVLARSQRPITVRILVSHYPRSPGTGGAGDNPDVVAPLEAMLRDLEGAR
ncbi:MAG: hypothetical protein JXB05_32605 [Myxococcaceae bacterium]|nr:hypothetical protein [Myxococcaceae bacterium]